MTDLDVQRVPSAEDRSLPVFEEFDRLAEQIRLQAFKLFAHRGTDDGRALDDWLAAEHEFCWPAAELAERDGELVLSVALAGFEPGEITVTATPRELLVKARHESEESGGDGEAKLRWTDFHSNNVMRRVELPVGVDVERVSATLRNGMLRITAPKAEPDGGTAREIEISADTAPGEG